MRYTVTLLCTALASPAVAQVPGVMTDTPIVQSLVAQVMGTVGAPATLLDQGADPHSFQLRPSQARALAQADLVFWIGPELTPWMQRAIDGTGTAGRIVGLLEAEGVHLLEFGEKGSHDDGHDDHGHDDHGHDDHGHDDHGHDDHGHDDHGHDDHAHDDHAHDGHAHDDHAHDDHAHDDHDHAHDGVDPHAWLSPDNARLWLALIASELGQADSANAAVYEANAAAAIAAIDTIEADVRATLGPVGDAPIMVFHDAYGYFADHFGLNVAGTIALGDAASPGAARLTEMRAILQERGVVCVFPEVNHSPAYAEIVVEGTQTRLGALLDPAGVSMTPGAALYGQVLSDLAGSIAACVAEG